jgi:hypothetical protein
VSGLEGIAIINSDELIIMIASSYTGSTVEQRMASGSATAGFDGQNVDEVARYYENSSLGHNFNVDYKRCRQDPIHVSTSIKTLGLRDGLDTQEYIAGEGLLARGTCA